MACGCAIVGSEGMPVGEVIQHDVNGLLVPINDILSQNLEYPHSWVDLLDIALVNPLAKLLSHMIAPELFLFAS